MCSLRASRLWLGIVELCASAVVGGSSDESAANAGDVTKRWKTPSGR